MGMVVEGVSTTKVAHQMARELDVDMPITDAIYQVLYENAPIRTVITDLMKRSGKPEFDFDNASLQNHKTMYIKQYSLLIVSNMAKERLPMAKNMM